MWHHKIASWKLQKRIESMKRKTASFCFKNKIAGVLKWGYEFTSIAGITQFRTTNCKVSKCAWFLLATFGILFTAYTVIQCVQGYLAYKTETTINIRSEFKMDFPSVTICNQNRVHCRHLYNLIQNCTKVFTWNIPLQARIKDYGPYYIYLHISSILG